MNEVFRERKSLLSLSIINTLQMELYYRVPSDFWESLNLGEHLIEFEDWLIYRHAHRDQNNKLFYTVKVSKIYLIFFGRIPVGPTTHHVIGIR